MNKEASLHELHANIGRCLSEWSRVEFAVHLLFLTLNDRRIRANDPLLASFEANKSFSAKRATLHTLVMSDDRTEGLFRDQFVALDRKLREEHGRRHEVAHFRLMIHHDHKHPHGEAMLHPFGTFTGGFFDRDKRPLTVKQVGERADNFAALADRTFRFVTYVMNVRSLLDAHDKPTPNPERLLDHPFIGTAPPVVAFGHII